MLRRALFLVTIVISVSSSGSGATFSTSVVNPTPIDPSGVIEGTFPESGKASYFLAVEVKPGELLSQIGYAGRAGAQKSVDFALLDGNARSQGNYWVQGTEAGDEKTRKFPIDNSGKQLIRLELEGPPTARFRAEIGGSAVKSLEAKPAPASGSLSRSPFSPTRVAQDGIVSGALPGEGVRTSYYLLLDLKKGDLLTQISLHSRQGADKALDFQLLEPDGRTGAQYWVHGEEASEEKTRSFPIDRDGPQLVRLVAEGPETATFKVELGGTALASQAEPAPLAGGRPPH